MQSSPFKMIDITESVKAKGENTTLLRFTPQGITPIYAKDILATYLLMEWPLTGSTESNSQEDYLRCYAILLPHGKIHVVEVFFMKQNNFEILTGTYLGTTKVYSLSFPDHAYHPSLDDTLSETIWSQVAGYAAD